MPQNKAQAIETPQNETQEAIEINIAEFIKQREIELAASVLNKRIALTLLSAATSGSEFIAFNYLVFAPLTKWVEGTKVRLLCGKQLKDYWNAEDTTKTLRQFAAGTVAEVREQVDSRHVIVQVMDGEEEFRIPKIFFTQNHIFLDSNSKSVVNLDSGFELLMIPEGHYFLLIFEDLDQDHKYTYGKAAPYSPSESFLMIPDTLEIRANWDIDLAAISFLGTF